ncbi:MAG: hypothetical protein QE263_04750 [Vampirovibrionales bacterium]|nr:hypothetical protein [Vampirovibrionales bacterium]
MNPTAGARRVFNVICPKLDKPVGKVVIDDSGMVAVIEEACRGFLSKKSPRVGLFDPFNDRLVLTAPDLGKIQKRRHGVPQVHADNPNYRVCYNLKEEKLLQGDGSLFHKMA